MDINTDSPVEEKIKAISEQLELAQKALVATQRTMMAANRLAGQIPMYKELNKRITELGDWQKEVRQIPW